MRAVNSVMVVLSRAMARPSLGAKYTSRRCWLRSEKYWLVRACRLVAAARPVGAVEGWGGVWADSEMGAAPQKASRNRRYSITTEKQAPRESSAGRARLWQ